MVQTPTKDTLQRLERLLQETIVQIQEERAGGPELLEKLEKEAQAAGMALDKTVKKLTKAKAAIKKRKREIGEWKQWYNGLAQQDKTTELKQLETEIKWRAAEITVKEQEVAQLNEEHLAVEGTSELLEIRIQALKELDSNLPIADDPRIIEIQAEIQKLKA